MSERDNFEECSKRASEASFTSPKDRISTVIVGSDPQRTWRIPTHLLEILSSYMQQHILTHTANPEEPIRLPLVEPKNFEIVAEWFLTQHIPYRLPDRTNQPETAEARNATLRLSLFSNFRLLVEAWILGADLGMLTMQQAIIALMTASVRAPAEMPFVYFDRLDGDGLGTPPSLEIDPALADPTILRERMVEMCTEIHRRRAKSGRLTVEKQGLAKDPNSSGK